eukprot:CAMPEP_0197029252 /NCGR_PEP_ID=MMETSP1384-20130603/8751_1 /TAXON_ID=29189 /ORGANISM="Ammonia sp." /LENGTH=449 /DNA_ID=CAMNT_0042458385 /DNA_START=49 /DNA_END=1398 /DNA_ORIENTATION=-
MIQGRHYKHHHHHRNHHHHRYSRYYYSCWDRLTGSAAAYCLAASVIEPVPNDGGGDDDDNKKTKMVLKRRRKKKKASDDTSSEDTEDKAAQKKAKPSSPSQVDRINGHYQNRIRQLSTPEKIFSTFASMENKKSKEQRMNYHDFCEAILPYDFRNESAAANMKNQKVAVDEEVVPEFLYKLINKKRFSLTLAEFIFITLLLSIPPSDFEFVFKIFDLDGNGRMDATEFTALLRQFKQRNTSNYDITEDNIAQKTNIWRYLFGSDQKKQLTLEQFQDFLISLRETMLRIEYERYCGSIENRLSPRNFAMSLVSYAHHSEVAYYVARINRMPKDEFDRTQCSVSYAEFIEFNKCLFKITDIMRALKYYEKGNQNITQQAFRHTVKCITGVELSDNIVRIMFWVLDRDGDNTLDQKEIKALLSERFQYGQATDRVFLAGLFQCFGKCIAGGD